MPGCLTGAALPDFLNKSSTRALSPNALSHPFECSRLIFCTFRVGLLCTILWIIEKNSQIIFCVLWFRWRTSVEKVCLYTIPGARAWKEVGLYESLTRSDGWGLRAHFPEENGLWEFKSQHEEIPIVKRWKRNQWNWL